MSSKHLPGHLAPGLLAGSLLLLPTEVMAAGYKLMEQSVTQLGRAYAGESLVADDASAAFYNPADMMLLRGNYLQVGTTGIDLNANFEDEASNNSLVPIYPLGDGDEDAGTNALVPLLHYIADVDENTRLGLAITAPFGLTAEYDKNWIGRYHVTGIGVKSVDVNPSFGYRLTSNVSIGLGVSYQYFEAVVDKKIFTGGADLASHVVFDDWSWGYNAGITGDFGESRLSLAYRSHITHNLEGDISITGLPKAKATAKLELPATTTLSFWHRLNHRWELMASARYTEWEVVKIVRIHTAYGSEITPVFWRNSWMGSVGLNFRWSPMVMLRSGISYDATPIAHEEYRTPRVPDGDRLWFSIGAGFAVTDSLQLDIAYAHLFTNDISTKAPVHIANDRGTVTLDGNYDQLEANLLGLQLTYRF